MSNMTLAATEPAGFYLDGRFVTDGKAVPIHAPFDEQVVGTAVQARGEDVEAAIAAAVRAFEATRKLPAFERQRVLRSVAQAISSRREEMARVMALEAGKPIKAARVEVERAAFTFNIAAEEATRIGGEY